MGNRTTTQRPHEHLITSFQTLKKLPIPLSLTQCIQHKHELLICGDTIKNKYKFICEYPSNVQLYEYCVVKLVDNNNQITLLSFGGSSSIKRHTLVMKYVIIIGRDNDDYFGVRAVIGGSNNNLLFITYIFDNISVFDLNTFQFIKHDTLPIDNYIQYHCFVSNSADGYGQGMMKTSKQNYQMLLFCFDSGLSIEYNEDNNTFQFPLYGPLFNCVAILNEEDNHIHIIGGLNDKFKSVSTHMRTKVCM
ncbi:hypothetical protein RFI_26261 [Reticulomyxa filosa]|uniref:Uncharacterized protein n=1 Tax=Reticulomyxa filosa TaxID=46433 RepID=X6MB74_RETFI|nr:hypothetical protein RFI_26261 [Reticulomyxa filosa]|eukprot:ETO11114.1 hypothetical protein RFI_26261 [Reticulomyxa filosa]